MAKSLYFNIEDDLGKVTERLKRETASDLVLVFPKKSYLFSDGVNLKLLKKQTDLLKKSVAILTMDERGQVYAEDAGFALKQMPKGKGPSPMGDIRVPHSPKVTSQVAASKHPERPKAEHGHAKKPAKKASPVIPHVKVKETIFPDLSPTTDLLRSRKTKRDHRKKIIIGAVALGLITVVLLVTVILPQATVVIHAKTDPVARDIEVRLSKDEQAPDVSRLVMPALAVDQTLEARQKFTSVGKKEVGSKAEGQVRIFNFTGTPLNLKASTTTLSIGEKQYFFTEDQNNIRAIPERSATDPNAGHVAKVVAAQGGTDYNTGVGTRMEITNQVFGSRPQLLYARTESELVGGNSRFLSVVSQEDLEQAKQSLSAGLLEQLERSLGQQGLGFADGGVNTEVVSFATDKPQDTESPNFEASIQVRFTGLAVNTQELQALLRKRIAQMLPQHKRLQPESLDTVTYRVKSMDTGAGQAALVAHIESRAIDIVPLDGIASRVKGKSKEEASEMLLAQPEISKVDISLRPAWQRSLPKFAGKITVKEE